MRKISKQSKSKRTFLKFNICIIAMFVGVSVDAKQCLNLPYFTSKTDKTRLSSTWFLDSTGIDMAKRFTKKYGKEEIQVGILDGDVHFQMPNGEICKDSVRTPTETINFGKILHAHTVSSFISGPDGASDLQGKMDSIVFDDGNFRNKPGMLNELNQSVSKGLRVLNNSTGYQADVSKNDFQIQEISKLWKGLDRANVIIVTAAGNSAIEHPTLGEDKESIPGIVVGAADTKGKLTAYSQYSSKVLILAPGDDLYAEARPAFKALHKGTSYSAPLVTGSIVNALKILPAMNRSQVETLLTKTATKLGKSDRTTDDLLYLNAYKMVRVANRIRKRMPKGLPFSEALQRQEIDKALANPKTFDFKPEAEAEMAAGKELEAGESCGEKWEAVKRYRKAFLLSGLKEAKLKLKALYTELGYKQNADFYAGLP